MKIAFKKDYVVLFFFALILFVIRIISFREFSLDPDELEWLYDIRKCFIDPRPFVGFDAHTSGPFAIYLLALIKLLTGFSKLYQLRLISFFLFILPSLFLIYQISQKGAKLIGGLAFVVLICAKNFPDFGVFYDGIYSYNTEYQILLFTTLLFWILRNKNGVNYYVVYALILFLLPYIKFQAIPCVLFFGGYLALKLWKEKQWKMLIFLSSTYLIFNLIWLEFMYFEGIFPDFYHVYILKNLNYMSNSSFGEKRINPINFFHRITGYYQFIYIFLALFCYQLMQRFGGILKTNLFEILLAPISQSFFLLIVASAVIIISKNDFGHYYIFLFLPLSIFIADLANYLSKNQSLEPTTKTVYPIFVVILFCNFNFDYLGKSMGFIWNKSTHQAANQYNFGKPLPLLADENLIHWLKENKGKNEALLVLGWTEAQAIYYVLQNDFRLQSRSSNSFYLQDSFRSKNKEFFAKEEQNYLDDMKVEKPKFIVDTWNLLSELKGTKITQFVSKNYSLKVSTKKYQIYERLD